jgi:hypothetical protein
MDILNEYLEEYKLPTHVKRSLRSYFHHCRYIYLRLQVAAALNLTQAGKLPVPPLTYLFKHGLGTST